MLENLRIMKRSEVEYKTGLSRSSIYAKMADGTFPRAIKLGARSVGWLESDINQWVNECIAKSNKGGVQ